ncbi:PadR family transcriptional regulator [Clostridium sp. SHJSY1]|uniref:PadR family transcriptional regulator n=1 Tax=Clostridium sp. SHJSY1 TaxID=2942483 RepID=UPI002875D99D|nr:PadR family transcriptional regulator [Clostridium sp. SHJSY1]MDS0525900.1 PadR family transcriptional regulator [Clostridium sp. SHJSY1]
MANTSQLLKGVLEGCILKVIKNRETYGYELYNIMKDYGFENISEGTLHPLLIRLEKNGLLKSELRDSPFGPKRKYFSLTEKGKTELKEFDTSWNDIVTTVKNIWEDNRNE